MEVGKRISLFQFLDIVETINSGKKNVGGPFCIIIVHIVFFVSYLASRTAQQVNYQVFSRELGINVEKIKRWISILITSGIIVLLEPFMANVSNRIIKAPKLYLWTLGYAIIFASGRMLGCLKKERWVELFLNVRRVGNDKKLLQCRN